MNAEQQKNLAQKWLENTENVIKGNKGDYKIDKSQFVGKGGFGIVYVALRKIPTKNKEEH